MALFGAAAGLGFYWCEARYVQLQSWDGSRHVAYRVAQYLDREVPGGQRVLLLAPPSDHEATRLLLEKARETGGEEGPRRAREEPREVVYSRLPRERVLKPPALCGPRHLVDGVLGFETEGGDFYVEAVAVGTDHLVGASHLTCGGLQRAPGGVFEALTRGERGLLTDDARTFHFLDVVEGVCDDPVAADELDGIQTLVRDSHCV
jgi:hypothetical protein